MAAITQLRYSPLNKLIHHPRSTSDQTLTLTLTPPISSISPSPRNLTLTRSANPSSIDIKLSDAGGGGGGVGGGNAGSGGGRGGDNNNNNNNSNNNEDNSFDDKSSDGIFGLFLSGWRSRVTADPQFPFKVLMEELVGVTACLLGDMATRPNFGLNELDFVFSTLIVGSIMNFVLMYVLAPTMAASSPSLPAIFARSPTSHMFEPGAYTVIDRFGTFVYKGILFASIGFAAGLVGTAISNGLIKLRKKLDPNFETPNQAPPTLLNALTWSAQMGLSSNFRYQTLNGIEFVLAKSVSPAVFKSLVVVLRCLNNVLGGVSFVTLARLTGSQKVSDSGKTDVEVKEKLLDQ